VHLLRLCFAFAITGCASTSPQPVFVSPDDLDTAQATAEGLSADSPPSSDYRVSEIEVAERTVILELVAESHGKGWQRVDHATCQRCADGEDWSCVRDPASVQVQLSSGSWISATGLTVDDAQKVIQFLSKRSSSDPALQKIPRSRLQTIGDLTAISEGRICAEYGPITSIGHIVLKPRVRSYEVESVIPPPNWAEGRTISECGGAQEWQIDMRPALPLCDRPRNDR
jgi:hypothetical protein